MKRARQGVTGYRGDQLRQRRLEPAGWDCGAGVIPDRGGGVGPIELQNVDDLTAPLLIAAFEGWNDAGDAASGVIKHLIAQWDPEPVAAIDPEDYYDFQVTRPTVELTGGRTERLVWPTTQLFRARPEGIDRDIVLVAGIEPNMRWRTFCGQLVEGFTQLRTEMIVLLGALLADAPHTRPVPVSGSVSQPELGAKLSMQPVDYNGPTGIVGVLQHACGNAGLAAVSMWASVPHYVAQPPSPKATLALIRSIENMTDLTLPLDDLPEQARAWERGVDELAQQDSEVAEYVRALEDQRDAAELPEASGDAIAREFEKYLRRRGNHGDKGNR